MITNSTEDGVSSREDLALKAKALTTTGAQQSQVHPIPPPPQYYSVSLASEPSR